jgi:hypothetical protein
MFGEGFIDIGGKEYGALIKPVSGINTTCKAVGAALAQVTSLSQNPWG